MALLIKVVVVVYMIEALTFEPKQPMRIVYQAIGMLVVEVILLIRINNSRSSRLTVLNYLIIAYSGWCIYLILDNCLILSPKLGISFTVLNQERQEIVLILLFMTNTILFRHFVFLYPLYICI